jgi:phage-related protein
MQKAADAESKAVAAAQGSGAVNELGEAFGKLGGPVGSIGQKIFGVADGFKKLGGAAGSALGPVLALVAIVAALTVGVVVGAVAVAKWGVELADAGRSAQLSTEALSRTSSALKDIGTIIPAVADKTGLGADALTDLAKQLDGAKVSAKDMPAALEAAAIAEAALGKGGASKLIEDLKSGKKSATELAAEMKSKFGDIVQQQMISLGATGSKLKSNISEIFGGLNIEGFLGALSKGADLLDKNSASGKALKFLFESIFQPLIDGATAAYPTIERIFLGLVLGALKFYNATKPLRSAIGEVVASLTGGEGSIEWLDVGVGLFYALVGAIGSVVAVVALMAAPFVVVVAAVYAFYAACVAVFDAIAGAIRGAMDIDLSGAASAMIDGLVNGITSGASAVISAVTNLASSAVSAAESALGIASPSKVFAKIGGYTSEGMAQGVDDGAAEVDASMRDMVSPPDAVPPQASPAGASGGSGLNLAGAQFIFQGVKDAEQAETRLRAMFAQLLAGGSLPAPAGGAG